MKASVIILILWIALGEATEYLAWKPGKNYVYGVQAKLRAPECYTENGGLAVDYKMLLTPIGPNLVHVDPYDFQVVGGTDEQKAQIPILEEIQRYVESPMAIEFSNGNINVISVESDLPNWAMDLKREQASYFSANSNGMSKSATPLLGNSNVRRYMSKERSIHGKCDTKYNMYRIHAYNGYQDWQYSNQQVKDLCNQDDKIYELVKTIKLYTCDEHRMNISSNGDLNYKPIAETRFIACGRRSQNQYTFLKVHQKFRNGKQNAYESEEISSLYLISINLAVGVKSINSSMTLNSISKEYVDPFGQVQDQPLELTSSTLSHPATNPKKVVIVHMTNRPQAVLWALDQGANGIELDLHFDGNEPAFFQHSVGLTPCDCTCACLIGSYCPPDNVCNALWNETTRHCTAFTFAQKMTTFLGQESVRSRLALIYIDCKLSNSIIDFFGAGYKLVKMLDKNTFGGGYLGQVLISGLKAKYVDFIKGAASAVKESPHADKYFYTFDGEYQNFENVWDGLMELRSKNIAYATGITACLPTINYVKAIKASLDKKSYAGVQIWTIDNAQTMQNYLNVGVDAIMTHFPARAVTAIGRENLATPGNALVPKEFEFPTPVVWECDCNFHFGGCTISRMAPPNHACKCNNYGFIFRCAGKTVPCRDLNADICKNPDASYVACMFGGGDCGGYKKN